MFLCFKREEKMTLRCKTVIIWEEFSGNIALGVKCETQKFPVAVTAYSTPRLCLPQPQQLLCSVERQAQDVTLRKNFAFGLCFSSEQKRKKKKSPPRVFSFPSCSAPPARPTTSVLPEVTLLARGALPPSSQWSWRLLGGDPVPAAAVFPNSHQAFSNLWDLVFLQHSLWICPLL